MKTLGIFSGQSKYAVRASLKSRILFDGKQLACGRAPKLYAHPAGK
jgi:hypothetical protein